MPVYDYKCPKHGVFSELATIENHAQPNPCPHCGDLAGRVIIVAPDALNMDPNQRKACAHNERAQHQPQVVTTGVDADEERAMSFGERPKKCRAVFTPSGEKVFPSARPWMISH